MTREAEVGDHFPKAKVVKTTTFGAFVELVKGTDGLLHISNVKPGERVDTVEDVLSSGRRDRRHRGRGRQGARPDRPAPLRGPGDRRQDARRSCRSSAPATRRWVAAEASADGGGRAAVTAAEVAAREAAATAVAIAARRDRR